MVHHTGTRLAAERGGPVSLARKSSSTNRTPPSLTQFGLPDLPDSLELALDAAAGQAQPVGDLFIPMAFELALGNGAQAIVVEHTHQTLIFFHCDRQHFRRRGIAQDFVKPRAPA